MIQGDPFPSVTTLAGECSGSWPGFATAAKETVEAEKKLSMALQPRQDEARLLDADCSLVLFGSFARYEMLEGSDYDWAVLVDGVVNTAHSEQTRTLKTALSDAKLIPPGSTGTFGGLIFSHDLIHFIGGEEDSNANLTRRMLMLLESRPVQLTRGDNSERTWENVVKNVLKRYFEEDVHFRPAQHRVPRFMLNDLTRYWRTICVDYAAKHREQGEQKWALRNAKLRLSRKLLYAAGVAFCLNCELQPPAKHDKAEARGAELFIQSAMDFAKTPPLEYLALFVRDNVPDSGKRARVATSIFGSYSQWLELMSNSETRGAFKKLSHSEAGASEPFQEARKIGTEFACGLRELFFDRRQEQDLIAKLSLDYVGF
ncbi:MAG TPA: nucleotidyltransferase domain-containing protein [Verrucomicrobiae bacterium]|jgi:predicted nucleotidyltransferase|nr:nucleotidyltransferase domain-containing protein [Verrucomicrobiae bacterium]